jgi:hypothetical protein
MVSIVPSRLESGTTIGAPQFDLGLVANGEETRPVTMATVQGSGTIASSLRTEWHGHIVIGCNLFLAFLRFRIFTMMCARMPARP